MPIATSVLAFAPASALPDSAPSMSTQNATPAASIGARTIIRKNSRRRLRKLIVLAGESTAAAGRSEQRSCRGRATLGPPGAIAQLGERLDRTQEVGGSSPPSSIPARSPDRSQDHDRELPVGELRVPLVHGVVLDQRRPEPASLLLG